MSVEDLPMRSRTFSNTSSSELRFYSVEDLDKIKSKVNAAYWELCARGRCGSLEFALLC